ncbi:hypothetical protein Pla110_12780 [Polystyrenella longa]|uniref:Uncharacterized protein n=1 Tax=Polystyrenella longa TaxID=2528007 RepID=A0A518CK31_9PLAN|nr:hypothetical protein [Polystyrenella longa]QDU79567.1 hypothetical protein Pla110_12780 [Polystyrenella longa]
MFTCAVHGEEVRDGFDGPEKRWQARTNKKTQVDILEHSHSNYILTKGKASERFEVMNRTQFPERVDFYLDLPPARVIPDLKVSVWFRSNRQTAGAWLRITLPNQPDPRDKTKPLQFYLAGDAYRKRANEWEMLTCQTDQKRMNTRLQQLRSEINYPQIDIRGMYVDQLTLSCSIPNGPSEFFFDELHMDPVVTAAVSGEPGMIQQTAATTVTAEPETWNLPFEFRLDRLSVQGQPFFPIMIPSHNESAASIGLTGVNTVWVQDYRNYQYLQELRRENLWATATPPYVPPPDSTQSQGFQASPAPFDKETMRILFWTLGARVPAAEYPMLIDWKQQIHRADQKASRPLFVDVLGDERKISRHFDMISSSRHTLHTSMPLDRWREFLIQKQKLSRPGTFSSTWIQTEPASRFLYSSRAKKYSLVVEPEQIRLQAFCALQAGCDALGYWTTTPLASDFPGAYERRLAITDLNLELSLIEPWIARGDIQPRVIPFELESSQVESSRSRFSGPSRVVTAEEIRKNKQPNETIIEGRVIKSEEYGSLMLAVCYNQYSQYVPGSLTAKNVSVIIPSVPETASAWEITPTGLKSLDRQFVAGGARVTLDRIDQTAMIVLTSNRAQISKLEDKIAEVAQKSAQTYYDLASAKLARVRATIEELQQQGVSDEQRVPSMSRAPSMLSQAGSLLVQSEQSLQRLQFHDSRQQSEAALRMIRSVQFQVWHETVFPRLTTPVSSPYTIAFSSLPSHWEMIEHLGRSNFDTNENLLPLGNFETEQTTELTQAGWENFQENVHGIRSGALLTDKANEGKYALRLAAVPAVVNKDDVLPAYLDQAPIRFNSPRIPVQEGQLLYISGYLRIARPIQRSDDGFMIYDNLGGQVRTLRWFDEQDWTRFSFLRVADSDTDFQISMELTGMGEVHVDDLQVIPINPQKPTLGLEQVDESTEIPGQNPLARPFRYLNELPKKLNPFRKREDEVE